MSGAAHISKKGRNGKTSKTPDSVSHFLPLGVNRLNNRRMNKKTVGETAGVTGSFWEKHKKLFLPLTPSGKCVSPTFSFEYQHFKQVGEMGVAFAPPLGKSGFLNAIFWTLEKFGIQDG